MSWNARHLSYATLADLVEGRLVVDERTAVEEHLAACARCAADYAWLAGTIGLMRDDTLVNAPPEAIDRAIRLFRPHQVPMGALGLPGRPEEGLLRRIAAVLSFDSGRLNPSLGVRSTLPSARQLLWNAPPYEIDVRITPHDGNYVVAGQVLGPCLSGEVELQGHTSVGARLNQQCEWTLSPVPAGEYTLVVRLIDAEITIPKLQIDPPYGPR